MKKLISLLLVLANIFLSVNIVFSEDAGWDPFGGDKNVNIVFIGGSITQGEGYRKYMSEYLKKTYEPMVPGRKVTCINSGRGGTDSGYGSIRLKRDVVEYEPDMVFVEFAVNDINIAENKILNNMETIVRNLQSLSKPPMIVFVYTTGTNMKNVSEIHHKLADYYGIPEIDFKQYMIDEGFTAPAEGTSYDNLPSKMKMMYGDLTHPNSKGGEYWADYANSLLKENPKKYFVHPKLMASAMTEGYAENYYFDYVDSIDALNSGEATVTGEAGKDYTIDSLNKRINLKTDKATYSYEFTGKRIKVEYLSGTANGIAKFQIGSDVNMVDTYGPYNLTTPAFSKDNISSGTSIYITPTVTKSDKSTGTDISIKGFFVEADEKLIYPTKYSDDLVINEGEEENVVTKEPKKYQTELKLAIDLGIFENDVEEMRNTEISRAKFAQMISNIILPNRDKNEEWYKETFYEDNNDIEVEKEAVVENIFVDVEVNHENFDDIRIAYNYKLMNGVSSTRFMPEDTISAFQAGVVLTKMLGYRMNAEYAGGYPEGYSKVISELGILKGISDYDEPVTYSVLAKILSNVYDVKVYGIENIEGGSAIWSERDNNFLSFYFDIDWVSGQMTQNVATTMTEKSKGNETIVVGGQEFLLGQNQEYVNEYIGRDVKVYYNQKDDEEYDVVVVYPTEKDEIIKINARDFIDFKENTVSYYLSGREKKQKIADNSYVIYNGLAISVYDKDIFDFSKGDITLIKPKSGNEYNVVVINDYRDWIVVENDVKNMSLVRKNDGKVITDEANEKISYDRNDGNFVFAKDLNGSYIDISAIKPGDVLNVAKNGNIVKIICSDKIIEGFSVSSNGFDEDGNALISNGETEFTVLSEYAEKDEFSKIIAGHTYRFFIDAFGYIVWSEQENSAGVYHGMLLSVKQGLDDDGDEGMYIRIMGFETGIVSRYVITENIKITNNEGKTVKCTVPAAMERALCLQKDGIITDKIWDGFITYTLDKDGNIKNIDMARTIKDKSGDVDVIYDILATENLDESAEYGASLWHQKFKSGNKQIFYDKTKTWFMACKGEDERKYISSKTPEDVFTQDKKYNIKAYGNIYGISTAQYIVRNNEKEATPNLYAARNNVYLVKNVTQEINEEDEILDKIEAIKLNKNGKSEDVLLYSEKNIAGNGTKSVVEECPDLCLSGNVYKIEKGDIIAVLYSDKNTRYIDHVYMIYKNNASVPGIADGKKGWIVGAERGYYKNASDGIGNPYSVAENSLGSNAINEPAYSTVVTKGYIEEYRGGVIKYTTRDLSVGFNSSDTAQYIEKNIRKTYSTTGTGGYAINYYGNRFELKSLEDTDIKPYENYRNNASAFLTILSEGSEGVMIVINKN